MTLVVDASVIVAALIDDGPDGRWAESVLTQDLVAPHHLPVEVASSLRRLVGRQGLSADMASLAHADLLDLRIQLFGYALVADRVWELRENLTAYDAWYVAVAESLEAPLATLDERLAAAPGPHCLFRTPGG